MTDPKIPTEPRIRKPVQKNVLVGRFFHSLVKDPDYPELKDGRVQWQGRVIGSPEPGWWLVETYSYADGSPYVQYLIKFEDMAGWLFYETDADMRGSYTDGAAREGGPYRADESTRASIAAAKARP